VCPFCFFHPDDGAFVRIDPADIGRSVLRPYTRLREIDDETA
jgi:hypothetical protein